MLYQRPRKTSGLITYTWLHNKDKQIITLLADQRGS